MLAVKETIQEGAFESRKVFTTSIFPGWWKQDTALSYIGSQYILICSTMMEALSFLNGTTVICLPNLVKCLNLD